MNHLFVPHPPLCVPVVMLVACMATGCASSASQRSTALTVADFEVMIADATLGLLRTEEVVRRSSEDPEMRITFDRITNLTSDLLTASEQWMIVEQVLRTQELVELRRQRNVSIIIPASRSARHDLANPRIGEGGRPSQIEAERDAYSQRSPTHRLEATLRSATRIDGSDRAELYECVFLLTDLRSGNQTSVSSTLIKRAARGRLWD